MAAESAQPIRIDLSSDKLHACLRPGHSVTFHFNTPSRRFYLALIAFLVICMKRAGKIAWVPLQEHLDVLALLNETVGGSAGSSDAASLLGRIYRKWKGALPDLQNAPLFRVLGRARGTEAERGAPPSFAERERDLWANLFDYTGSEENVRLRFSLDRIGLGLDDVLVTWGGLRDLEAWDRFVSSLQRPRLEGAELAAPTGPRSSQPATDPVREVPPNRESSRARRLALCALALLLAGGAALTAWKMRGASPSGEAPVAARAPAATDKPALAVLPFENMSGDQDREYFSDGLTEDLITALAKLPDILVISRSSSFTYKGSPVKVQKVAEDLGVRYVLEGSVQAAGDRVRITAQLIDAESGHHLWSERYDRELKDIFAVQDDITFEITKILSIRLSGTGEGSHLFAKGTDNLEAYLKLLRGKSLMGQFSGDANLQARQLAEEVIGLDPRYPSAYYLLATTTMMEVWLGVSRSPRESMMKAIEAAQTTVSLDDGHAAAWALLGFLYAQVGQHEKGLQAGELAVEKAPSSAEAHSFLAQILNFSGRPEEAVAHNDKAFRLTPLGRPGPIYLHAAHTYRLLGRYGDAIEVSKELLARTPNSVPARVQVVLAYQGWRRPEEARSAAQEVLRYDPGFSARRYANALKYKDPTLSADALEQMLAAGLPE
ncbi:MAG: hypothetical protein SCH98_07755 [Deferrisomatales bacterium]|nr:hypothetical protein [Deferrisomatales bacterium]